MVGNLCHPYLLLLQEKKQSFFFLHSSYTAKKVVLRKFGCHRNKLFSFFVHLKYLDIEKITNIYLKNEHKSILIHHINRETLVIFTSRQTLFTMVFEVITSIQTFSIYKSLFPTPFLSFTSLEILLVHVISHFLRVYPLPL